MLTELEKHILSERLTLWELMDYLQLDFRDVLDTLIEEGLLTEEGEEDLREQYL